MATSQEIMKKIGAVDVALVRFKTEAESLSLAAVEGDKQAAEKLATLSAKMDAAAADRAVFERAWTAARIREAADAQAAKDANEAGHYRAARDNVERLHDLAAKLDAVMGDFGILVADINAAERAVWVQLNQAKAAPADANSARNNLAGMAFSAMNNVMAKGQFKTPRTLAETVRSAWAFLLTDEKEAA